ncbi:glycosyltransferase family 2 protein [Paraburkholderia diazotrophica]|uniref:glycosyltransferase family 2 protein n=1 Tax=Paraburkholderia diazotrophica TaxID=667676 RepID=UPI003177A766
MSGLSERDTSAAREAGNARAGRRVFAIVVTLNPEPDVFAALLDATCAQVDATLVIDNGSTHECVAHIERACAQRAALHRMSVNLGIAAAQNKGIALARERGATDVLLLDHDSVPEAGMVMALADAARQLRGSGWVLGAVGPAIVDRKSRTAAPVPVVTGGRVRFVGAMGEAPVRCEYLIASGMLIALEAFDATGPMNKAYFVDQVDVEWCLRAGAAGRAIFCVPQARLEHAIGDDVVSFWLFGRRELPVHSPARDYFYFRNSVRLMRSPYVSPAWRRFWARRLVRLFVVQTLFAPPRLLRLRAMLSGAWTGLTERNGTRAVSATS